VEPAAGCPYDSVTLYDGSSASSPQLGKYCSGDPGTITSSGSSLFIRFTSDYSIHDGRFSLTWSFVSQGGGQGWYSYNQWFTVCVNQLKFIRHK